MIKNIVIVGGGTSGWLTAAVLKNSIKNVNITLIDKDEPDSVGVGEATILNFDKFIENLCGFSKKEWIPKLEASFKAGILFLDWDKDNRKVWHPFYFPEINNIPLCDVWSNVQEYDLKSLLPLYDISLNDDVDIDDITNGYAYHINCKKLVEFVSDKLGESINNIKSEVVDISRNNIGNITELKLKNGLIVSGDFFVDCTGFKSILKKNKDKVDLSDRLFCDTAIAGHIDYLDKKNELHPFVISHAVNSGWIWNIPLQSRIGSGLVFNRSITSINDAKKEFVDYWENRISEDCLTVIDWTPYYDKNIWEKNVVSIGLGAGFIEPLESTGIALIIEGISKLSEILSGKYFNFSDINMYNSYMIYLFESCIDFVNMHYARPHMNTPFWNYVNKNFKMTDIQKMYLNNMISDEISIVDGKPAIFGGANWIYWLIQFGYPINEKKYIENSEYIINSYINLSSPKKTANHTHFLNSIK